MSCIERISYFVSAIMMILIVSACTYFWNKAGEKQETPNNIVSKNIAGINALSNVEWGINVIEFDGHEYLLIRSRSMNGICHKADCKYCKKGEEK